MATVPSETQSEKEYFNVETPMSPVPEVPEIKKGFTVPVKTPVKKQIQQENNFELASPQERIESQTVEWDFSYQQQRAEGKKIFNFSSGPGCLPKEVLRHAQSQMLNWRGTGMSVMELSHRSKEFHQIADQARASIRTMLEIPEDFEIFFTQGGAQM